MFWRKISPQSSGLSEDAGDTLIQNTGNHLSNVSVIHALKVAYVVRKYIFYD
jgi:hypothetical protein